MIAVEAVGLTWHPRADPARCVLDDVTMQAPCGSVTALVGRNGSGKSTLLRVLAGVLSPRSGMARVMGLDGAHGRRVRAMIGLLPEENGIPDRVTPLWHLRLHALLRGRSWESSARRARETLAMLGVDAEAERPMGTLSRGTRQRIAIARALVGDPAVLLLDEPDATLDQQTAAMVGAILRRRAGAGGAALVATHDGAWARRWCDQALAMDNGRIAGGGT